MPRQSVRADLRSITVDIVPSCLRYRILLFPSERRRFFPAYKSDFILESNLRPRLAHVTGAESPNVPIEDRGRYVCGRSREWYDFNRVRVGDRVRVKQLEWHRRYRISKLPR